MKKNVGSVDRLIRVIVGLALVAYAIFATESPYHLFGYVGLILVGTALMGWCPPYALLGINTCGVKKA